MSPDPPRPSSSACGPPPSERVSPAPAPSPVPSRAPSPPRVLLPGWTPLRRTSAPREWELGSTFLPYEREVRERYVGFDRARRRTEYGSKVPGELIALLRSAPAPGGLSLALGRRATYLPYPLPGRPFHGPWVVFEDRKALVREGRPFRLSRPLRREVAWKEEPGRWHVEEVLQAVAPEPLGDADLFPRPRPSARSAGEAYALLAEKTGLSVSLAQALLLPFVGAPPWRGRAPGVDALVGTWGEVPTRMVAGIAPPLRDLLPPWELAPRAKRGQGRDALSLEETAPSGPYGVEIGAASAAGLRRLQGKGAHETSFLLYGGAVTGRALQVLFEAHLPLLEPLDTWTGLSAARLDEEEAGAMTDQLIRAHFSDPEPLEGDALHRGTEGALSQVREALARLPRILHIPSEDFERVLLGGELVALRDQLVQAALARARLIGHPSLLPEDLQAVSGRIARSIDELENAVGGGSASTRELLRIGEQIRSRKERDRIIILRALLLENTDLDLEALYRKLSRKGLVKTPTELERFLRALAAEGIVVEGSEGLLSWQGF